MKVEIRPQRVSDAKRFYKILNNPNFLYFPAKPKSIEKERAFLRLNLEKWKKKKEFNFSIIYNGEHVGAVGVMINSHYHYIGEAGYFVDEKYWGRGIAVAALKELERFIFDKLEIKRIEMIMAKENKASKKVAIKCGYKKEGILKRRLLIGNKYFDCYLYAKVIL